MFLACGIVLQTIYCLRSTTLMCAMKLLILCEFVLTRNRFCRWQREMFAFYAREYSHKNLHKKKSLKRQPTNVTLRVMPCGAARVFANISHSVIEFLIEYELLLAAVVIPHLIFSSLAMVPKSKSIRQLAVARKQLLWQLAIDMRRDE